jgi:CRISPR/Cas system-associated protein Cas10 (large subunit of type III CRISPR-Cas system)
MQEEVLRIALAGLLHDVGKFAQRAGWRQGAHAEVGGAFCPKGRASGPS